MTTFGGALHRDNTGVRTSAELVGAKWKLWTRRDDGDDAAIGATTDAAVSNPATAATALARLASIAGALRVSAAALLKDEDAAHADGDAGVAVWAVRRDTAASGVSAAGDYATVNVDALGRLWVRDGRVPGYSSDATPVAATSGVVSNTAAVATLAGAASVTTWLTGFEITAGGATAAGMVTVTAAGLLGGTLSWAFGVPAGVGDPARPLIVQLPAPIPASAVNTAIVITCPALGAGNTHACATAHGFRA